MELRRGGPGRTPNRGPEHFRGEEASELRSGRRPGRDEYACWSCHGEGLWGTALELVERRWGRTSSGAGEGRGARPALRLPLGPGPSVSTDSCHGPAQHTLTEVILHYRSRVQVEPWNSKRAREAVCSPPSRFLSALTTALELASPPRPRWAWPRRGRPCDAPSIDGDAPSSSRKLRGARGAGPEDDDVTRLHRGRNHDVVRRRGPRSKSKNTRTSPPLTKTRPNPDRLPALLDFRND